MSADTAVSSSSEFPEYTDRSAGILNKQVKYANKPLLKFRIQDLLSIPYNHEDNTFNIQNFNGGMVMCGGKISDVFQDDDLVSFELNDGTGSIKCFHKYKLHPDNWLDHLNTASPTLKFLQDSYAIGNHNDEGENSENTIFKSNVDESLVADFENEAKSMIDEVLYWFENEIVEKRKKFQVGNIVHVIGILLEDNGRKIHAMDFRMVTNQLEHEDFQNELQYFKYFGY